jgi:hypothetical protein
MKTSDAVRSFQMKLALFLISRGVLQGMACWFFIWGVIILVGRITGSLGVEWLSLGVAGFIPVAVFCAVREWRRRPGLAEARAAFDHCNRCGGLVMAQEAGDVSAWEPGMSTAAIPAVRWRSGRLLGLLGASALFVAAALSIPDKFASFGAARPMEIGRLIEELHSEIELLEEERIIEEKKAQEVKDQLARFKDNSSGLDPGRTWEALDHIKESNSQAAQQAAEEAIAKMTSLTQAETLASALQSAAGQGLDSDVAIQAAQSLASLLNAAKLEEGLLNSKIPSELQRLGESGLSAEDLEKLLAAIRSDKSRLGELAGKLAKLKLIDAEMLGLCLNAGECPNIDALVAFLCESGGECDSFGELLAAYCRPGRGGITRGRGDAPMTWSDPTSEQGAGFTEQALPPAERLSSAQLIGLSRAAPDLSAEDAEVAHGVLTPSSSGGGAALSRTVLPRHRRSVELFFKREE